MKKVLHLIFACGFSFAMVPAQSQAAVIGSFDIDLTGGIADIFDSMWFSLRLNEGTSGSPPSRVYLAARTFTAADAGWTTSLTGTDFDDAVALLTNGTNDGIGWGTPFTSTGSSEAISFFGDYTGASGIDFSGETITAIEFTLNRISFDSPGRDPNGDGVWTDYDFHATLAVHAVPVPAAIWLFGSALIGLAGLKAKNHI